ncbi:MAG: hypothetical protein ACSHXZ_14885 [Gammaproteobacteria bacterium]
MRLSIVWAILGMAWAATGIVSNVLTIRTASSQTRLSKADLTGPNLTPLDPVVDRTTETENLVQFIEDHQAINLHGRKGSGKSHFLSFVADCSNGHRKIGDKHTSLKNLKNYRAVYVDLSESLGFEDVLKQIFSARFPSQTPSWSLLIDNIDDVFGASPVILILDNVNAEGVWGPIGRALYAYLARRPDDRIVLGSIQAIRFHNLNLEHIEFGAFNTDAIGELARSSGIELNADELATLEGKTDGLALFLRLLFTHWDQNRGVPAGTSASVRLFLVEAILPRLDVESIELLVAIALASVANPEVDVTDLKHLPIDASAHRIQRLRAFSLLVRRERNGRELLKTHDLIRDAVVDLCSEQVEPLAEALSKIAMRRGDDQQAALYSLYCHPKILSSEEKLSLIRRTITNAVRIKAYPLLATLSLIWQSRAAVKEAALNDDELHYALLLGRSNAFAGVGDYQAAITSLNDGSANLFRKLSSGAKLSPVEFELALLHADLIHLQNKYDEALNDLYMLQQHLADHPDYRAKIEWMIGHVMRHQGINIDEALSQFAKSHSLAVEAGDVSTEIASLTGQCTIQVLRQEDVTALQSALNDIETRISGKASQHAYLPKLWKSQAQIAFNSGNVGQARKLIEQAISRALENNDRLLFNYHFERAEFSRLSGDHTAAIKDYEIVLNFGRENGDRNLIANALLGISEAETSYGNPIFHKSDADMRASILQSRAIAADADIQLTVKQAEMTLTRFETRNGSEARLFLF